jgi:hypothetical protein
VDTKTDVNAIFMNSAPTDLPSVGAVLGATAHAGSSEAQSSIGLTTSTASVGRDAMDYYLRLEPSP